MQTEFEPLVKKGKSSIAKNAMGDADNFSVPFPPNSTFEHRLLLIATALFIDYMMFESNSTNDEGVNSAGQF